MGLDMEPASILIDQVAPEQQDDALDLLCRSLSDQLGPFGYQWLCACAVLPVLQLTLTIHLGETLASAAGRARPSEQELFAICRLPWFRKGWIPDELRLRLARDIADSFHGALHEAISRFVFSALEASSRPHEHLSPLRLVDPPRNWPSVLDAWLTVGSEDTGPDVILLSFMRGRPVDAVRLRDVAPSQAIRSRFRDLFDQRTRVLFVSAMAISAGLWVFADPRVTMGAITASSTLAGIALLCTSAAISVAAQILLRPFLLRYALARPYSRSSPTFPTPQGGGIGVIVATFTVVVLAGLVFSARDGTATQLLLVLGATVVLAIAGAVDDLRGLSAALRLLVQFAAVGMVLAALPADWQLLATLPWWLDRMLLLTGCVYFLNLVNVMDGIDWMTVVEVVPITASLLVLGALGALPSEGTVTALALGGAMLGFAPFNRPVARLFLGDVGSLPIALLLGWMLLLLAQAGHVTAAFLLPLYYLADGTLTLLRRLVGGARIWKAHRAHFYQRAVDRGIPALLVVARVFVVNIGLGSLAVATVWLPDMQLVFAALGCVLVAWLLWDLQSNKKLARSSSQIVDGVEPGK